MLGELEAQSHKSDICDSATDRSDYEYCEVNIMINVLEGLHHEALEDNCLKMNVSATVYKIFKIYITRWS